MGKGLDQLEQFIALSLEWGIKLITEFNTNGEVIDEEFAVRDGGASP